MPSSSLNNSPKFSGYEKQANGAIDINLKSIRYSYIFPIDCNGMSAGPISIENGAIVTIPIDVVWSII